MHIQLCVAENLIHSLGKAAVIDESHKVGLKNREKLHQM
jgi:RecG-like helicase